MAGVGAVVATLWLSILCATSDASPACLGSDGRAVDWFVALKLPNGPQYAIFTGSEFQVSGFLNDTINPVARTLQQVYSRPPSDAYGMYNDEEPSGKVVSSRAHMKGVLQLDTKGGFWLIHSIPRFPANASASKYSWPDDESKYGQHLLCISLAAAQFDAVGRLLQVDNANFYDALVPAAVAAVAPELSKAVQGVHDTKATANFTTFSSFGGVSFTGFAKNSAWDDALYEKLVEPHYKAAMSFETWVDGVGKMPSCCGPAAGCNFSSYNNDGVRLSTGQTWKITDGGLQYHGRTRMSTLRSNSFEPTQNSRISQHLCRRKSRNR